MLFKSFLNVLKAAALVVPFMLSASSANANFLLIEAGNTNPGGLAGAPSAEIDFAVFVNVGGGGFAPLAGSFVAGVGSGAFDAGAKFLYVYDVKNTGVTGISSSTLSTSQNLAGNLVSSFGVFAGHALIQTAPLAAVGNPSPASIGGPAAIITPGANPPGPLAGPQITLGPIGLTAFWFTPLFPGQTSQMFGFTSDFAPTLGSQNVANGTATFGTVPIPDPTHFVRTPEPSSIALLGLGALGLLVARRRKLSASV